MKKGRFSEEQISVLKQHEAGRKVADLAREHGISEATMYTWKASTVDSKLRCTKLKVREETDFLPGGARIGS